jgi:hypothetical protein
MANPTKHYPHNAQLRKGDTRVEALFYWYPRYGILGNNLLKSLNSFAGGIGTGTCSKSPTPFFCMVAQ